MKKEEMHLRFTGKKTYFAPSFGYLGTAANSTNLITKIIYLISSNKVMVI